jgi:hypothetical protein
LSNSEATVAPFSFPDDETEITQVVTREVARESLIEGRSAVDEGYILYVPFNEGQQAFEPVIQVINPHGDPIREIPLPGSPTILYWWPPTCNEQHGLFEALIGDVYWLFLVDPTEGIITSIELDKALVSIGEEASKGYISRECSEMLVEVGQIWTQFLNTATGFLNDFSNLDSPDGRYSHVYAEVSRDENYLLLHTGSKSFLISTNSVADYRLLGEFIPGSKRTVGGNFSSDSEWIVYTQVDYSIGENEIIIETVDGRESRSILTKLSENTNVSLWAFFVPDQDKLLISHEDHLSLFDLNQMVERELIRFPFRSQRYSVISPSGRKLIIAYADQNRLLWSMIDLDDYTVEMLDGLIGYHPWSPMGNGFNVSARRFHLLREVDYVGSDSDVFSFDLETGQFSRILEITEPSMFSIVDNSSNGNLYLIQVLSIEPMDYPSQLWLMNIEEGTTLLLDEAHTNFWGSLSPSGKWAVIGKAINLNSKPQFSLDLKSTSSSQTIELAEGAYPIWLAP